MMALTVGSAPTAAWTKSGNLRHFRVLADEFPSFLPRQVEKIKDPFARKLAKRIERLPVQVSFSESSIMSSCVRPLLQSETNPVVLLHGFDSSCLEWRYTYPLLEEAGLETWAVDILGWGFSDLGVYAEGTGNLAKLPRTVAYAGVSVLKSMPLRLYANLLAFKKISFDTILDQTNVGRLHCLLPWWEDATVDFMISGGYNVSRLIDQVNQKTLIIWGEDDKIFSSEFAVRLHHQLPNAIIHQLSDCGHLPHVDRPNSVAKLIVDFVQAGHC